MQPIGIIGGIAPGSTVEYYRKAIAQYQELTCNGSYPRLLVNSVDFQQLLAALQAGDRRALADFLVDALHALARAGAKLALIAANAPHVVFDEVSRRSPIELVSIVESAARHTHAAGHTKVGLLGARFTMQERFYSDVFERYGIEVVPPAKEDLERVHDLYINELSRGILRDATRAVLLDVIGRMKANTSVQAIVLGGTELPLLLTPNVESPLKLLDTTQIHVSAALKAALGRQSS